MGALLWGGGGGTTAPSAPSRPGRGWPPTLLRRPGSAELTLMEHRPWAGTRGRVRRPPGAPPPRGSPPPRGDPSPDPPRGCSARPPRPGPSCWPHEGWAPLARTPQGRPEPRSLYRPRTCWPRTLSPPRGAELPARDPQRGPPARPRHGRASGSRPGRAAAVVARAQPDLLLCPRGHRSRSGPLPGRPPRSGRSGRADFPGLPQQTTKPRGSKPLAFQGPKALSGPAPSRCSSSRREAFPEAPPPGCTVPPSGVTAI